MANNGSIDEVIGQDVLKQVEDLSKSLKDLEDQFVRTAKAASTMSSVNVGASGGGGGVKQTTQGLTELEKATAKLNKTMNEYGQDIVKFRLLQQQQAAANKNEAKETLYAAGSYKQLEAQMATMVARYKTMSAEMRGGAMGKALAADIATINTQLKGLDSGLGNMQRNVGNYASALSKVWSVLRQAAYVIPGLGIAGILNLIGEGIGYVIDKFDLFRLKASEYTQSVKEAFNGQTYKDAISSIQELNTNIDLANKGLLDKDKVIYQYNKSIGEVAGTVKTWSELEDKMAKATPAYIQMMYHRTKAQNYLKESTDALAAAEILAAEAADPTTWQTFVAQISQGVQSFKNTASPAGFIARLFGGVDPKKDVDAYYSELIKENKAKAENAAMNMQNEQAKAASIAQNYGLGFLETPKPSTTTKVKTRVEILQEQYDEEVKLTRKQYSELYKTEEEWQIQLLEINKKYSRIKIDKMSKEEVSQRIDFDDKILKSTQDVVEKQSKALNDQIKKDIDNNKRALHARIDDNKKRLKDEEDTCKAIDEEGEKLWNQQKKREEDAKKDEEDRIKARQKFYEDLINSTFSIANSISDAIFKRQLDGYDKIADKINEVYKNELRFIEQSGLSQREKERKKQTLEAETEAKRKKNDRDRVTALRKQAVLQKALDTAQIIANTAIAITSHMKLAPPLNLINIASDIAIGAAQLAKVVATPLPQYAKGRKGGKAEMAIVGEVGTEAIVTKDGKISFTPNKATKTFLPEGADVIPNHELIKNATLLKLSKEQNVTINKYQEALIEKFEEELTELKSIKQAILDKPVSTFNNFGGFDNYVKSNIR